MAKSRYPKPTTQQIKALRDHCLEREANGNKPGGQFTNNVDLRRGIIFYHYVANEWYLRRDWRKTFNERFPQFAVPEEGTLKPRKWYASFADVREMVRWLQHYDRSICYIKRIDNKLRLFRTTAEDGYDYRVRASGEGIYLSDEWRTCTAAYEDLKYLHDMFRHCCEICGCDWLETPRYIDDGKRWHCGCCHATPENDQITGAEPALPKPVNPTMEPMLGSKHE